MILLLDVGNTHTHLGLSDGAQILRQRDITTGGWTGGMAMRRVRAFLHKAPLEGAALCSVVPLVTARIHKELRAWKLHVLELGPGNVPGIGIDYPNPKSIGPDRLANAVAVKHHYGAPAVVVDFGTAVTFDVVDAKGNYVGGIIAPGLAAMTDYLHEKTALLPRIRMREVAAVIGKNTKEAMLIGAVHGYRGLVGELIRELKRALGCRKLPVVGTGGYAELIAARLPEITAVDPLLTLEGLRLAWCARKGLGSK